MPKLKDVVDMLRRELLLVEDVGKIDTFGERARRYTSNSTVIACRSSGFPRM